MALRKNQFLKAAFEIMGSPGIITFAGGISLIFGQTRLATYEGSQIRSYFLSRSSHL